MDTQLVTLSKIFTERLFRIPDYQRGYAWQEKQLKEFWNDVEQLDVDRNHYTGVLTLESIKPDTYRQWSNDRWIIENKSYEPYYVVDGQQRLTTAMIAIQVILERTADDGKLNFTDKDDIRKKFIFDSKDNLISRSYLFSYEEKDPSLGFLRSRVFGERSSGVHEETVYTQNLERAKAFFEARISALDHEGVQLLFRKLTQNLMFNVFTISEDVDVCVAFETMNNRGKPLSYLELLKNRLIYLSLRFDASRADKEALRTAINASWRSIYHNLGRNKSKPLDDDSFLMTHYIVYFGEDTESPRDARAYRRLRYHASAGELLERMFVARNVGKNAPKESEITLSKIYDYVSSLEDAIKAYYNIFNPLTAPYGAEVRFWLDKMDRLGPSPFLTTLLVLLTRNTDESKLVAFLQAAERYVFVTSITDRNINRPFPFDQEAEMLGISLAVKLHNGSITADKVIKTINEQTSQELNNPYRMKEMKEMFRADGFYRWGLIRYFLYEYNLDLQSRSKTNRAKIDWESFVEMREDYVTVEHVYPQRGRADYWVRQFSGLTQKQRTTLKNSLGNLLPLSKPKNSSLSNVPFHDKVDGRGADPVGFRYGCYAENEVARCKDWNPFEIKKRGMKLLAFMERRWGFDLGSEDEKAWLLGVEFVYADDEPPAAD